jgi:hypothetical protein
MDYERSVVYNLAMKKLYIPIIIGLSISACSTAQSPTPSKNEALLSVTSGKEKKKEGAMQKALDNWLEKEWTPTVEKDEEIKKVNEDEKRAFTLQEYVDKAEVYSDSKAKDKESTSHAEEMNRLPGIGTK